MIKIYKENNITIDDIQTSDIPWIWKDKLRVWVNVRFAPTNDLYTLNTSSLIRSLDHTSVWEIDSSVKIVAKVLTALIADLQNNWIIK